MRRSSIPRRDFVRTLGLGAVAWPRHAFSSAWAESDPILDSRPLVRYPEKTDLILLTSRPPQLETPIESFDRAITPNSALDWESWRVYT